MPDDCTAWRLGGAACNFPPSREGNGSCKLRPSPRFDPLNTVILLSDPTATYIHDVNGFGSGEFWTAKSLFACPLARSRPRPTPFRSTQVRTPRRVHQRLQRHWCTQANHNPAPAWCTGAAVHGSRTALTLRCLQPAFSDPGSSLAKPAAQHTEIAPMGPLSRVGPRTASALRPCAASQMHSTPEGRQSPHDSVSKTLRDFQH